MTASASVAAEPQYLAAGSIDLEGGWNSVYSSIQGAVGPKLFTLMTAIGVLLVVFGIVKALWDKRRGGGGGFDSRLIITIVIGAALAAPQVIMPLLLTIADFVANGLVGTFNGS